MKYQPQFFRLRRCSWIYLLLLGLTVSTYRISELDMQGLGVSMTVLLLALLKGQLLGDYFMGLKVLHGPWRWPIIIWLLTLGMLIGSAFYLAAD